MSAQELFTLYKTGLKGSCGSAALELHSVQPQSGEQRGPVLTAASCIDGSLDLVFESHFFLVAHGD